MDIRLEPFDPQKHDADAVARLIYQADPDLMSLGFGTQDETVGILKTLISLENNQYSARRITCAQHDGRTVGIILGFTGQEKETIDQKSGQDWAKAFGIWRMIKLLPRAGKLEKIVTQEMAPDEYNIFGLAVEAAYRGQGIGSRLMEQIMAHHDKICLDVNIGNEAAQRFYQRHGFEITDKHTVRYRDREIGNYCMRNWQAADGATD